MQVNLTVCSIGCHTIAVNEHVCWSVNGNIAPFHLRQDSRIIES